MPRPVEVNILVSSEHGIKVSAVARLQPSSVSQRARLAVQSGLIVLFAFVVYFPAMRGGFLWDDDAHITKPKLRSLEGLTRIWTQPSATQQYYPLAHSAFWVQQKLWGDSTPGYHFVNVLLHAICALLFFGILRQLEVPGAALAAAIFALHPVHVESVAWITELKNTLSGVLYFGSALAYLRFHRSGERTLYGLALGLFALGLLAKTAIAPLPAALLIVLWWKRGRLAWKQDLLPLAPFFLVGLAAGLLTVWFERKLFLAEGGEFDLSIIERCLMAGRSLWHHLGKLFWPTNLTFMYPRWDISQTAAWQYLYPAAALLLLIVFWVARGWNRGPLAGLLFFVATLFPALGFFNAYSFRYSFVNDHHQYLASLGIITLMSGIAAQWLNGWQPSWRRVGNLLGLAMLGILAILTWKQSGMYRNMETLWRTTIARNSESWIAHNNLGLVLLDRGQVDEAVAHFQKALQLKPNDFKARYNLGTALAAKGQFEDAINCFRDALQFKPNHSDGDFPSHADAYYNLGLAFRRLHRTKEAIMQFREALRQKPNFAAALNNLAWILSSDPEAENRNGFEAVQLAERACQLTEYRVTIMVGTLGAAYAEAGRFEEAVATARKAEALATLANDTRLAQKNRELEELFGSRRPFHESPGAIGFP